MAANWTEQRRGNTLLHSLCEFEDGIDDTALLYSRSMPGLFKVMAACIFQGLAVFR